MESVLKNKSYDFAIRVVKLNQYLIKNKKEFVLSKQVLRSGTGICAFVREAEFGQSKADFTSKMSIALKEANETDYLIAVLKGTKYLKDKEYNSLKSEIDELIKLLFTSVKTSK
ncbi:MAG: four helix bundle protein [Bacteroidetes bacterium]|nr:MAG: four helix bundle protein [Bacteroidota bacterium]